jgi:hypothetical protein
MNAPADENEISWESFELLRRAGGDFAVQLAETPPVQVRWIAAETSVALIMATDEPIDTSSLNELESRSYLDGDGTRRSEIRCSSPVLFRYFFDLALQITERVTVGGRSLPAAVNEVVASWELMVRKRSRLSPEQVTGLLGELWFLRRLLNSLDVTAAVSSWMGPGRDAELGPEEHDFKLPGGDVEVKSTLSESRTHIIGSLSQLEPSPDRPLWLLSVQFTASTSERAETLSSAATSLADLIEQEDVSAANEYRERLEQAGWTSQQSGLYTDRFELRTKPVLVRADDHLPRLRPSLLDRQTEAVRSRVSHIRYRLNVDGLGTSDGSDQFSDHIIELTGGAVDGNR